MAEQNEQEYFMQQMVTQYRQLEDYIKRIDSAFEELENTREGLKEYEKLKGDEEILAPVAQGIFVKAKITNSKKVTVNVGNNVMAVKTIPGALKLLEKQEEEMKLTRADAEKKMNELASVLQGN